MIAKKKKKTPSKKDPKYEVLQRRAEEEVALFKELAVHRYKMAKEAFDYQDASTQHAIGVIRDRIVLGANGLVRISPRGAKGESYAVAVELEIIEFNALFVATEIVKDLALFDLKLANYEFPPSYCADCGVSLKKTKREKKVKLGG